MREGVSAFHMIFSEHCEASIYPVTRNETRWTGPGRLFWAARRELSVGMAFATAHLCLFRT